MTYEGNERNLANKIVFVDEIDKKEVVVAVEVVERDEG